MSPRYSIYASKRSSSPTLRMRIFWGGSGWLAKTVSANHIYRCWGYVYLESTFAKYHSVMGSSSASNEALARPFINLIIFNCLLEERMIRDNPKRKARRPQPNPSSTPLVVTSSKSIPESPASTLLSKRPGMIHRKRTTNRSFMAYW